MKFSLRQWSMIATPILLIISMWTIFINFSLYFGLQKGYLFSFIIYWVFWCFLIPLFSLKGLKPLIGLFKASIPRFGDRPDLTLSLLLWPIIITIFFGFIPQLGKLSFSILIVSILLGFVNGFTEEILWRGVYVAMFPDNVWLNYIYPSVTFALWHICPISVIVTRFAGGIYSYLFAALLFGLSWGFYARKTGSIRWCAISHAIRDSLGIGGLIYVGWFL